MLKWVLIAIGGAAGSMGRYALHTAVQRLTGDAFPLGTLIVNLLGCLAIGFLAGLSAGPHAIREEYRLGLMVGVVGGFTTFSTFGLETFDLMRGSAYLLAALNVLASCAVGLAAVWLGYRIAVAWFGVSPSG